MPSSIVCNGRLYDNFSSNSSLPVIKSDTIKLYKLSNLEKEWSKAHTNHDNDNLIRPNSFPIRGTVIGKWSVLLFLLAY